VFTAQDFCCHTPQSGRRKSRCPDDGQERGTGQIIARKKAKQQGHGRAEGLQGLEGVLPAKLEVLRAWICTSMHV
jgi:hypothetical protein